MPGAYLSRSRTLPSVTTAPIGRELIGYGVTSTEAAVPGRTASPLLPEAWLAQILPAPPVSRFEPGCRQRRPVDEAGLTALEVSTLSRVHGGGSDPLGLLRGDAATRIVNGGISRRSSVLGDIVNFHPTTLPDGTIRLAVLDPPYTVLARGHRPATVLRRCQRRHAARVHDLRVESNRVHPNGVIGEWVSGAEYNRIVLRMARRGDRAKIAGYGAVGTGGTTAAVVARVFARTSITGRVFRSKRPVGSCQASVAILATPLVARSVPLESGIRCHLRKVR